jgi:hypothetical protein
VLAVPPVVTFGVDLNRSKGEVLNSPPLLLPLLLPPKLPQPPSQSPSIKHAATPAPTRVIWFLSPTVFFGSRPSSRRHSRLYSKPSVASPRQINPGRL